MADEEKKDKKSFDKPKRSGKIKLRYNSNNKYDLHINRKVYTFLAYETKELPIEITKDKNWEWEKQFFQVIGG